MRRIPQFISRQLAPTTSYNPHIITTFVLGAAAFINLIQSKKDTIVINPNKIAETLNISKEEAQDIYNGILNKHNNGSELDINAIEKSFDLTNDQASQLYRLYNEATHQNIKTNLALIIVNGALYLTPTSALSTTLLSTSVSFIFSWFNNKENSKNEVEENNKQRIKFKQD